MTILKDDQDKDDRDITGLLIKWRQGDKAAFDALVISWQLPRGSCVRFWSIMQGAHRLKSEVAV
jgi:hypothetical protein